MAQPALTGFPGPAILRSMSNSDSLRAAIRAQNLSEALRRAEFQAIAEALLPEELVRALAPADLRGRQGYLVATDRRVFFAHAGMAGRLVSPVASTLSGVQFVEDAGGTVSLIFRSQGGDEVRLDQIPKAYAEAFARSLTVGPEPAGSGGDGARA